MKIGVRGHDIMPGASSAENLVNALGTAGIDTLQLVCYKSIDGVRYIENGITREQALSISGTLINKGINVALLGAYFNPVHPDNSKSELGEAVFKEYLALAEELGTTVVASETGSFNGDKWTYHPDNRTQAAKKTVTETFSRLCVYGEEHGVNVGIEGAAGHVCYNIQTLKSVVKDLNAENVRVVFDYYNFMEKGNRDYISIIKEGLEAFPSIHCFHIKDCSLSDLKQAPVGWGDLDFKGILSLIKAYDKNAVLIMEGTPGAGSARSAAFLKEIWEAV